MKYVDEYRDPAIARQLLAEIRDLTTRRWVLMEVCGGQTHGLLRSGIVDELEGTLELIHGPGCPVCVTAIESIDFAQELALRPDCVVTSFGDMLRVPGSRESLLAVRARGGNVRIVYSPLDAVELARQNPLQQVIFLAVGFETTAPATALAVLQAAQLKLNNFTLLVAHVRVQPAMESLLRADDCRIQGFLAAGHVCTVLGFSSYTELSERYHVPIVVTGFEPVDLLSGIKACVQQLEAGQATVCNQYTRNVRETGNSDALRIISEVFQIADRTWRGLGQIPAGGLVLRPEWRQFDADYRFTRVIDSLPIAPTECLSGDVLAGRIKPPACPSFGTRCTPETPLGAPMVSSEGACAAYYRHRRHCAPGTVSSSDSDNSAGAS